MTPQTGWSFTRPEDGDMRGDSAARVRLAERLGVPPKWATAEQVHGSRARVVESPGSAGPADALVTDRHRLPLAVFTADCLGVVLGAGQAVGVAHAGWRGLAAGVLESAVEAMRELGAEARTAHIGPSIGPCCFEVGDDVASRFPDDLATTTWGTRSVDLVRAATRRLDGIEVEVDGRCTACGGGFSHRRDGTGARMAAIGWLG